MSQHVEICINAVGDPKSFPELEGIVYDEGELTHVVILEAGMASGQCSLALYIKVDTGRYVMVQTSAVMLLSIAGATRGAVERFKK